MNQTYCKTLLSFMSAVLCKHEFSTILILVFVKARRDSVRNVIITRILLGPTGDDRAGP